jgi:predicted AlkP superfamily pyrophosphatase or phosphodiesterase
MIKKFFFGIVLGGAILGLSGALAKEPSSAKSPTVILVSMDGFRSDYWDKTETPHFHELMKKGVVASHLKPVFPSVTFVNHYSIITGLWPEHHGIINNSLWDPETQKNFEIQNLNETNQPEWWEGEPLWVTAEKQGVKSASMFWVGSSVNAPEKRPSYWLPYSKTVSREKRVEQVLEWLNLPQEKRPRFLTLYFEDADEAGHAHGPNSPEVVQAIRQLDEAVGRLVAGIRTLGLEETTSVILVSDHGMTEVNRSQRIRLSDYVTSEEARIVGKGALVLVWPKGKKETEALRNRVKERPGHFELLNQEQLAHRFHYSNHRRIPPIVLLAREGWYFEMGLMSRLKPGVFGLHGYDNALPDMQAVFLGVGPEFPKNKKVGEVNNLDIYPLVAHLLKIQPAKVDGDFSRISGRLGLNLSHN